MIGGGSSGDIAIDDITVLTGSCIKIVKQGKLNLKKVQSQNGTAKYVYKIHLGTQLIALKC